MTRAALAAGAPPMILDHIRNTPDPVSKLIDLLKESGKKREGALNKGAYETGRVEDLNSDEEGSETAENQPRIKVIQAMRPDDSSDVGISEPLISTSSANAPRSSRSRSPVDPRHHSNWNSRHRSLSSSRSNTSPEVSPRSTQDLRLESRSANERVTFPPRPDVSQLSIPYRHLYSVPGNPSSPNRVASRNDGVVPLSPLGASPRSQQFLVSLSINFMADRDYANASTGGPYDSSTAGSFIRWPKLITRCATCERRASPLSSGSTHSPLELYPTFSTPN